MRCVTGATLIAGLSFAMASPALAGQTLEGVPAYQHVGVLVLENESEATTWGASSVAVYLNSLVSRGAFASNYYADGHVSLDNYVTMTSGQPGNPATDSDCLSSNLFVCQQTVNTPAFGGGGNIADQVEGAGLTWKEYADAMPSPCFHQNTSPTAPAPDPYQGNGGGDATYKGNYADRHNGFTYYSDITANATRCAAHDVPYTQLAADIAGNTVPNYFFITPDTCHDGHDSPCASGSPMPASCTTGGGPAQAAAAGGLIAADCWLQANLPPLLAYLNAHDGLLFITTDEGSVNDTSGCCTGGPGGQPGFGGKVGLLALGPGVNGGHASAKSYDHVSLLRTMEDALGVSSYLNNASTATAMSDLFAQPPANVPEAPLSPLLPLLGAVGVCAWVLRGRRRPRAAVSQGQTAARAGQG